MSEQKQEEKGKVKVKYEKALQQVTAILGGDSYFKQPKADATIVDAAMAELAKDEKDDLILKLKTKAKEIIQEKVKFDQNVAAKKKEFDKVVEDEQKRFTEKAQELLKLVKDINGIEKKYMETLGVVLPPVEEEKKETEE